MPSVSLGRKDVEEWQGRIIPLAVFMPFYLAYRITLNMDVGVWCVLIGSATYFVALLIYDIKNWAIYLLIFLTLECAVEVSIIFNIFRLRVWG
ncbi:MAG: hypothetical protein ACTSPL_03940 [Candidatus Odinarchaeia archaeon]